MKAAIPLAALPLPDSTPCPSTSTLTNPTSGNRTLPLRSISSTSGSFALLLFLCGYFGSDYLGYEAAEGIDWVWEHRMDDLAKIGI
jgi:hypothetical protein